MILLPTFVTATVLELLKVDEGQYDVVNFVLRSKVVGGDSEIIIGEDGKDFVDYIIFSV